MLEMPRDKRRFRFPAGSCSAPYIFSTHGLSAVSNRPPLQKHTRPEMILPFVMPVNCQSHGSSSNIQLAS